MEDEKEKPPIALIQLKSNLKNIDLNSSNNTLVPAKVLAFLFLQMLHIWHSKDHYFVIF
jgi:hypothetical protein